MADSPHFSDSSDYFQTRTCLLSGYVDFNFYNIPQITFVIGDLFDEGKWCPPEEFDYYVRRFQSLFYVDEAKTKIHVMAGNHDIGFH